MTAEQIAGWDAALTELSGSMGRLFNRPEPRVVFAQFVAGLLAELPRKNGWTLAERAGHVTADRMQWLLNGSVWCADLLRDAVREYVVTHLGDPDASLVIDDTQAQKKVTKSVGVAYQHCGLTGDVPNCQTMVMLTYATQTGHAFIDRRLYLPEEWTADQQRCREPGCPRTSATAVTRSRTPPPVQKNRGGSPRSRKGERTTPARAGRAFEMSSPPLSPVPGVVRAAEQVPTEPGRVMVNGLGVAERGNQAGLA
ncbi:transposase [Streptomyces sp. NPDC020794]|uniref:IS701 family transposase n=1 Tax=unclassified Streptomyces TaxID=2593676 RepID=UPI0036E01224